VSLAPQSPPRRRRSPALWMLLIAGGIAGVGATGVIRAADQRTADVERIDGLEGVLADAPADDAPYPAENFLLVGSDSREGLEADSDIDVIGDAETVGGRRSDTIMILRQERNEGFDILPASQRVPGENWYEGTADAVYQNIDIIEGYDPEFIVLVAGDHIYKMNYETMLREHVESGADVTIACIEVPSEEAKAFGVMQVNEDDRILNFVEKQENPPEIPGKPGFCLASMGIYVFSTSLLMEELKRDAADPNSSRDFGNDIIPHIVKNGKAMAHHFSRSCVRPDMALPVYWRDVGTVDAYWQANIDLTEVVPDLDLYDNDWPIWTYSEIVPPAKFVHDVDGRRGEAVQSLVSGGCIVSGSSVRRSLLFTGVHIHSFASMSNAVVLPYVQVGRGARLHNVVVDRGVEIPPGLVIGEDPELDAVRFHRTEKGLCLVTQEMIDRIQD